jgi:chemotaxis protein MotA
MGIIFGFLFVLGMVFGGYVLAGGKFGIILHALPLEGMMIGGGAIGAMIIGNSKRVIKKTMKGIGGALKGAKFKKADYIDLLKLMYELVKTAKQKGLIALEPHIENPHESDIFQKYPKIAHDHFASEFICDTFRMITMSLEDPYQIEDNMVKQLEKHHHEALEGPHVMQNMADGLPAIGIVAAVLGVIKTMASIDAEVIVLGSMIGGALVGTFLGVFLAYCLVGPIASKMTAISEEESLYYGVIKDIMVGYLHGQAVQIAVENGRGGIPSHLQPTFAELEAELGNI